ncbi:MAG: ATP synthase F0 subunit C [Eubacteriales bacterium]|nr:ATP synthase F0 subunit C [Eubacteriales bacterium]
MKKMFSACLVLVVLALVASVLLMPALAEEAAPAAEPQTEAVTAADNSTSQKAIAAAAVVGVVATAGAIGMALAISKSTSGMARQPEVAGKINSAMMLGLVFIETAIIYALIVAILIIFVL